MASMTLKKKPMTKDDFQKKWAESHSQLDLVSSSPLRLRYHLQPPMGWLNDPNGLCQKDGIYHIYHQFVPFYPDLCSVFWGHVTTTDFIHYEYHEPVLYPDTAWDANGAYSGCTFQKDGIMHVYYTGNVRRTDKTDYDYITEGREQNTVLVTSKDGFHFNEKRLLMTNKDYPSNLSLHVRDPQVFCENGRYYMIQGTRDLQARGSVILFESTDLTSWTYKLRFETDTPFGYMWECPNYLKPDNHQFLIACPQGIQADGLDYANTNQCGYFPLNYDFEGTDYELGSFRQLDRGFDFYAPQVFQDESGRWILFGWMSTPDAEYDCEQTMEHGWVHAMTLPRELYVNNSGALCQRPAKELERMRQGSKCQAFKERFQNNASVCFELKVKLENPTEEWELLLRESAILRYQDKILSLDMSGCGGGRTVQGVRLATVHDLHILSDTSSLEIFVNGGAEVFTTRIYDSMKHLQVKFESRQAAGAMEYYELAV